MKRSGRPVELTDHLPQPLRRRRRAQQPVAWDCPDCGRHNARYLAQCFGCTHPRVQPDA